MPVFVNSSLSGLQWEAAATKEAQIVRGEQPEDILLCKKPRLIPITLPGLGGVGLLQDGYICHSIDASPIK